MLNDIIHQISPKSGRRRAIETILDTPGWLPGPDDQARGVPGDFLQSAYSSEKWG
jgi:hypothetical protein